MDVGVAVTVTGGAAAVTAVTAGSGRVATVGTAVTRAGGAATVGAAVMTGKVVTGVAPAATGVVPTRPTTVG